MMMMMMMQHFLMTPNAEHSEMTGLLEILPAIGKGDGDPDTVLRCQSSDMS